MQQDCAVARAISLLPCLRARIIKVADMITIDNIGQSLGRRASLMCTALLIAAGPSFGQYLDWPLKPSPGAPSLQAPARVVQDYSCVGVNLNDAPPPTPGLLDDTCVFPGSGKTMKYHAGMDIAAQAGADGIYYAPAQGTVVELTRHCVAGKTKCNSGQGNSVVIKHGPKLFTRNDHLQSVSANLAVNCAAKGAPVPCTNTVARGDAIGVMGATGNVTGIHFHFETFNTYPTGLFGYDTEPPALNSYQDPWGLVATTAISPTVVETYAQSTLRRGPGTNYSEMVQIGAASRFVALAESEGWFRVHVPCIYGDGKSNDGTKYNSCAGWVRGTDVIVQPVDQVQYVSIPYGVKVANIKSAPTAVISTNVVARAVAGQKLAILTSQLAQTSDGCNGTLNSTWHQVSLPMKLAGDPSNGWICSDDLRSNASIDQGQQSPIWVPNAWVVGDSLQTVAQTFTVGKTGMLGKIEFALARTFTGSYYLVDLVPYAAFVAMQPCKQTPCGDSDLQSSIFRTRLLSDTLSNTFSYGGPYPVVGIDVRSAGISVQSGERYAIVMRHKSTTSNNFGGWYFSASTLDSSGVTSAVDSVPNAEVCRDYYLYSRSWICAPGDVTFRTWIE